jgi:outer membrane receptor protein involved in Fe transport
LARVFCLVLLSTVLARADEYRAAVYARPVREAGDTVVLTGEELRERGVGSLADAIDLVPTAVLRPSGRGEARVDLRGVRQQSILLLVDGVPLAEPWFGGFDLASIPITDIVLIRVSLAPASPLDGPGGDGAVIEVETRRAVGSRLLLARERLSTEPDIEAAGSFRAPLALGVGLRGTAGGAYGGPGYAALTSAGTPAFFRDPRSQGYASLRFEFARPNLRVTVDGFYTRRTYAAPPTENVAPEIQIVRLEDSGRVVAAIDATLRSWRIAAGLYGEALHRITDSYRDATLSGQPAVEDVTSARTGAALDVERALRFGLRLLTRASFDAEYAQLAGQPAAQRGYFDGALGLVWRRAWLRLDGAAGVVVPTSASSPWPEAKLEAVVKPLRVVELRLIGARKGRLPLVRELFAPNQGNPALAPEQSWFVELTAVARPLRLLAFRLSGWLRFVDGMIRLDPTRARYANLDRVDVRGFEAAAELAPERHIGGGIEYAFGDAHSATLGENPLFNFPRHRLQAWLTLRFSRAGGTARVRYVGDRIDMGMTLPAYTAVDASAWWHVVPHLLASARVDNLFNAAPPIRAGLTAPPRTFSLTLETDWR